MNERNRENSVHDVGNSGDHHSDYGELYDDLLEQLGTESEELVKRWEVELDELIESGSLTEQDACSLLENIIRDRKSFISGETRSQEGNTEREIFERDGRQVTLNDARNAIKNPEKFLGGGAVAEVASMGDGVCVKQVTNLENYNNDNSIFKESNILETLNDFEVEGVRTPKMLGAFSERPDIYVILMEELPAVDVSRILLGHYDFPEVFDSDDFFRRLTAYVEKLHEKGVYHCDLAARNIMVDKETGMPYVIDFGKAVLRTDIMGETFDVASEIKIRRDKAMLGKVKSRVKEYFKNKG